MDDKETHNYSEPCGQCSAVSWAISDEGKYFCKTCHTIIEKTIDLTSETHFLNHRVTTILSGRGRRTIEYGRKWMVCEGFQFILKHQADTLLKLGVDPQFKEEVLCRLWRLYLQKSQQAYTTNPVSSTVFSLRFIDTDMETMAESSCASSSDTEGNQSTAQSTASMSAGSKVLSGSEDSSVYLTPHLRRNKGLMCMTKTLALIHLALLWTREALTLADLLRLVRDGHMPYINAYECLPDEMKLFGKDAHIFKVESIPSYGVVHKEAQILAVFMELSDFPPVSPQCLLHPMLLTARYLTEINLPDELHVWVCRVMQMAGLDVCHIFTPNSKPCLPLYDVQAAALIIVTLKLLFGCDDQTEWDLSNDASEQNQKDPEQRSFNIRRWYKLLQTALRRAGQREEDGTARRGWKTQTPIFYSWKSKAIMMKRRRSVENLQATFGMVTGSLPDPQCDPPSSFRFQWGDDEDSDGPTLYHQTLDGVLKQIDGVQMPSNPVYWHPVLRKCPQRSHFEEVRATLPRMYKWLLALFCFLLEVKPATVHEEVLRLERLIVKQQQHRAPPRKPCRGETRNARRKPAFCEEDDN